MGPRVLNKFQSQGWAFPISCPSLLVPKFLMKETGKLGLDGVLEDIPTVQVIKQELYFTGHQGDNPAGETPHAQKQMLMLLNITDFFTAVLHRIPALLIFFQKVQTTMGWVVQTHSRVLFRKTKLCRLQEKGVAAEIIILNKIDQTQEDRSCMISLVCDTYILCMAQKQEDYSGRKDQQEKNRSRQQRMVKVCDTAE